MTQKQKDILLKDLCARQMYDVKCKVFDDANPYTLSGVLHHKHYSHLYFEELDWKECDGFVGVEYCKPYLFPLSSMTDEQKKEYAHILVMSSNLAYSQLIGETTQDWFNKNHFDYRGLIEKGLAIDATGLNIY